MSKSINLKEYYRSEALPKIMGELKLSSNMAAPKLLKLTVNMGRGGSSDKKDIENALKEMELITGQKPVVTKARRSEAGFKIREGWPIGVKVTLRGDLMYRFLERLLFVALPASREFNGFSKKSLDKQGNFSFGISDQSIFREIPFDEIQAIRGLDITLTTSANDSHSGFVLLKLMGLPFREQLAGDKDGH